MKWLHLSDLHIRKKADWNIYKKNLFKHCSKHGPINLVIVTGDFHDFLEGDDFSVANEFLKELMRNLNLDVEKDLFLIPGNHDGSSSKPKYKEALIAHIKQNPTFFPLEEWEELLLQFNKYEDFVRQLITSYPVKHPAKEHCRVWNDKINFVHCNTAVVSDGKNKDNQLMDIDALSELEIPKDIPSVILAHNHFYDLHLEQRDRIIGVIRENNIRAYFCGDRHIQKIDQINVGRRQNQQIPCIVSYKSAPDPTDRYSAYGVIIGTWENEIATLEGWTWNVGDGFLIDSKITDHTIEMGIAYTQTTKRENDNDKNAKMDNVNCFEKSKEQFRKLYFNLSENQIERFNRIFSGKFRKLSVKETLESIDKFIIDAENKRYLNEMLNFMTKLYIKEKDNDNGGIVNNIL